MQFKQQGVGKMFVFYVIFELSHELLLFAEVFRLNFSNYRA